MKKRYDVYISAQNTPHFQERRIIFLLAMSLLAANLFAFSVLVPAAGKAMLAGAVLAIGFAAAQCFDTRKAMWTWGYIIFLCVIAALITGSMVFLCGLYWYLLVLAAEILLCCLAAFLLRKKGR